MEKNLIQQQLSLIEKLLEKVNSKEEILFLLGEKEALMPLRYILDFTPAKNNYQEHWLPNPIKFKGGHF